MRKHKVTIIILCGVDKTGKTTLKKEIEKSSNWKYIVLDRFTDSIVYDKVYKRKSRDADMFNLEKNLSKIANVLLVYCYADTAEIIQRCYLADESTDTVNNLQESIKIYEEYYLKKTKFKYIKLDTGKYTIESCVHKIIKIAEKSNAKHYAK